ncbi:MAG: hypothetical protein [Microvirus sp.]|nr:MAG: hypothetical protein [Microvirus sp.]
MAAKRPPCGGLALTKTHLGESKMHNMRDGANFFSN